MATYMLLRRRPRLILSYLGRLYSTGPGHPQQPVQTPVQSQRSKSISPAPAAQSSASNKVQTPLQAQNLEKFPPAATEPLREPVPLGFVLFCVFGFGSIPFITYYYYHYRKDHMEKKWKGMLEEARQKQAGA